MLNEQERALREADKAREQGTAAPGPYSTLDVGAGQSFHTYVIDCNGRKIAAVWGPVAEKVWTGALLAASYAMFVSLKAIMAEHERVPFSHPEMTIFKDARAIIAKIEGTS